MDIDADNGAFFAGHFGQGQCVESIAAAHVADGLAAFDAKIGQHQAATFFSFASVSDQPFGTGVVHGLGNFSTEVFFARLGCFGVSRLV